MDWYHLFLGAIVLLWWGATPRDRNAARIVLIATVTSESLVDFVTRGISGAEKLTVPGAMETITILALLRWAPNRTGYLNCAALSAAWVAHLLCYLDCTTGSRMVYDQYELIIGGVALAQLLAFHETAVHLLRRLMASISGYGRVPDFRPTGVRAALLPNPNTTSPQPLPEPCQKN